ncbi:MAG: substrate-binding domain-containing protein [Candidatus Devosia symbiotica]|nr:substrate-binding domain-containing protein [Candidatus Devosia symbiotica]
MHLPGIYDLELDIAQHTPTQSALAIGQALATPRQDSAFATSPHADQPDQAGNAWRPSLSYTTPRGAIVSFDDTQLFRFYPEGISAISQPVDEIARSIAETTLARLQGTDVAAITTRTIQCNLILRCSTRPPIRS